MKLHIGENIKKYRLEADMTQQQLADRLGVSGQSVSRWETGETYPDMELIPGIAGLFSVTTDALFGVPETEKEKKAEETMDALRRAALKAEIDPEEVLPLLRDIRLNYIDSGCAWRMWIEGNYRCFSRPEILPEVRLTAEAYLERYPMNEHVFQTMAEVEDEEHIEAFLKKHTTSFDTSERALLYDRYLMRKDKEKFEPERRYRCYNAISHLLCPTFLIGWSDDAEMKKRKDVFQSSLLELIRDKGVDNEPDMWVEDRLELGFKKAFRLAEDGKIDEALGTLDSTIGLLEQTMAITDKITLSCSCSWLDGMIWEAEEYWCDRDNNPDSPEQRAIFIKTCMNRMCVCYLIFPSKYYEWLQGAKCFSAIRNDPEFICLAERIKALIINRPKHK